MTDGGGARASGGPRVSRPVVLIAAAVLLVAAVAVLGVRGWMQHGADRARTEGLAAAVALVPAVLGVDHRKLAEQTAAAQAASTGEFAREYRELVERDLVPHAAEQQFVTTVEVRDAAVVSAEPDRLVALLFLSQSTTSTELPAQRLDSSSVRVTLDEVDGRWLVGELERL